MTSAARAAPRNRPDARAPVVLGVALLGVSLSAPLVRLSAAGALAIATGRLLFSLVAIAAALLLTGEWRQWRHLSRRELGIAVGAGVMLALHFWSWNASVALTSVAASVVLVNTQPVVVAVLSALWLEEPPTRRQWVGIAIALLGALIVALPDLARPPAEPGHRGSALLGDFLALGGAATAAVYFVAGRRLRATLDLWPYVGLVYGACFVVLLLLDAATGVHLAPQPPREWAIFAALALGPMLLGHTGLNWALKHSRAYVVNLTLLGEPVGATLIAAAIPAIAEVPPLSTLLGGVIVLAGIVVTANAGPGRTRR